MSVVPRLLHSLKSEGILLSPSIRGFCTKPPQPPKAAPKAPKAPATKAAAPAAKQATAPPPPPPAPAKPTGPSIPAYVSSATPSAPAEPVGPGASKSGNYPNTEYYTYDKMSYFDLEVEMGPDRIPQPSSGNGHF
ncbi:translation initiation factor IF-2-like [Penaeus japonicus]|uniref:translation initiation factor IF-2-like n=1 Tax=Penaeus japonicus TaxID=27405 RepID=UPI001C70B5EC|nr:translation initiation factor IF-2-like [Penaeus japonicus]